MSREGELVQPVLEIRDYISATAVCEDELVSIAPAGQHVIACAAADFVATIAAIKNIVATFALELIATRAAINDAGATAPAGPYPVREGTVTDTAELLAEAGYQQATIDNLLENGVIA